LRDTARGTRTKRAVLTDGFVTFRILCADPQLSPAGNGPLRQAHGLIGSLIRTELLHKQHRLLKLIMAESKSQVYLIGESHAFSLWKLKVIRRGTK